MSQADPYEGPIPFNWSHTIEMMSKSNGIPSDQPLVEPAGRGLDTLTLPGNAGKSVQSRDVWHFSAQVTVKLP